jgi:hypothetical protein
LARGRICGLIAGTNSITDEEVDMSVIMTLRVKGDPEKLESIAADDPRRMRDIADRAEAHGAIAHRFYGGEGQILVIDEWPDAESFQAFYEESTSEIERLMGDAGVTSEPEVNFWRKLESHDEIGWEG